MFGFRLRVMLLCLEFADFSSIYSILKYWHFHTNISLQMQTNISLQMQTNISLQMQTNILLQMQTNILLQMQTFHYRCKQTIVENISLQTKTVILNQMYTNIQKPIYSSFITISKNCFFRKCSRLPHCILARILLTLLPRLSDLLAPLVLFKEKQMYSVT